MRGKPQQEVSGGVAGGKSARVCTGKGCWLSDVKGAVQGGLAGGSHEGWKKQQKREFGGKNCAKQCVLVKWYRAQLASLSKQASPSREEKPLSEKEL